MKAEQLLTYNKKELREFAQWLIKTNFIIKELHDKPYCDLDIDIDKVISLYIDNDIHHLHILYDPIAEIGFRDNKTKYSTETRPLWEVQLRLLTTKKKNRMITFFEKTEELLDFLEGVIQHITVESTRRFRDQFFKQPDKKRISYRNGF